MLVLLSLAKWPDTLQTKSNYPQAQQNAPADREKRGVKFCKLSGAVG
jgi:hypothetical protein